MKHVLQQYQWFKLGDDMGTTLYVVADAMYLQSPLLLSPLLQFSPLLYRLSMGCHTVSPAPV